jgi:hypothetical protein
MSRQACPFEVEALLVGVAIGLDQAIEPLVGKEGIKTAVVGGVLVQLAQQHGPAQGRSQGGDE